MRDASTGGSCRAGFEPGLFGHVGALWVWQKYAQCGGGARDGLGRREGGSNHQTGPLDPRLEGRPRFALYGSRASLAAARPEGSSSQPRWSRPNPQGGCPGLGSLAAPRSAPCRTATTRAVAIKKKRSGGRKLGLHPSPPLMAVIRLLSRPHSPCLPGRATAALQGGTCAPCYTCTYGGAGPARPVPVRITLRGQPGTRTHTAAPIEIHEQNYDHERPHRSHLVPHLRSHGLTPKTSQLTPHTSHFATHRLGSRLSRFPKKCFQKAPGRRLQPSA